jgi:glutamyl-tRNA synthetase
MSKRKLAELVASGEVDGWDDPRFPTVRGMIRRGVQLPVLREFILAQGFSDRLVTMKWDKYWSSNKKFLEPRARRFMAIAAATAVPLKLVNVPDGLVSLSVPVHPKDASLGTRPLFFSNDLLIEQGDAAAMAEGEEVTLMQWGNVIIDTVARDPVTGTVLAVGGRTCSKGDVKATKLKVCFVARDADTVAVDLHEFDFLVSKPKMDDADVLADCLTSNDHPTRQVTHMVGEPALRAVTHGQIVQIMRRGMTRCDRPLPVAAEAAGGTGKAALQLFVIPDGKAKAMSAMATGTESIARR